MELALSIAAAVMLIAVVGGVVWLLTPREMSPEEEKEERAEMQIW